MRSTLRVMCLGLFACFAFPLHARMEPAAGRLDSHVRAERVESGLPAVTQGDTTLHLTLTQWMDALAVPGVSIAVIHDWRIAWTKAYGVNMKGPGGSPITTRTIFQAASIAKPVTALAILHQVERGVFALDADINDYLQSWNLPRGELQGGEAVTLRRLLAHTGGITPGGFPGYERAAPLPGILQILDGAAPATGSAARVVAEPGSKVAYSGLGYSLLQLALEDHLERTFESVLQDTVLSPLGLEDSSFDQMLSATDELRAARGHVGIGVAVDGGWLVYPELAAAGLWTTPGDLAKLVIDVANSKRDGTGHLLSGDMARQMLSPHQDEMGLGFVVRDGDAHGYFAHSGGNAGYFAHLEMLADSGDGVVIMTNSDAGQALASLIVASVANEYSWPLDDRRELSPGRVERLFAQFQRVATERVAAQLDPEVLARYVGKYELDEGLLFDIELVDGQLRLRLGSQPEFPIFAESDFKFFLKAVDAQITFVVDSTGRSEALILHQGGRDQRAAKVE